MNVYDFDNTLYRGESGVHMFFYYLKKRPGLIRFAPRLLPGMIAYKRHQIALDDVGELVGWVLKKFMEGIEDYEQDAKDFWDKHEHRLQPFYKELQHPDDLIISAGPEQSLREVCDRLGVSRYIGTVISEETGDLEFICYRENKVKAFREKYPDEQIDNFYTDSMNDKPLMDIARHVFLVGKKGMEQIK